MTEMQDLRTKILQSKHIWKLSEFQNHDLLIKEKGISNRLITDPQTWCWYCSHPCGKPPLHLPHRYNDRTDTYFVAGAYCSFSCMAAEIRDTPSIYPRSLYLESMRRKLQGRKMQKTIPAPPKRVLDVFGGWMTIQEFRRVTEANDTEGVFTLAILPPKMVPLREMLEKQESRLHRRVVTADAPSSDTSMHMEHAKAQIPSTNFRLRRVAPEKEKQSNVLEKIMGITTSSNG